MCINNYVQKLTLTEEILKEVLLNCLVKEAFAWNFRTSILD